RAGPRGHRAGARARGRRDRPGRQRAGAVAPGLVPPHGASRHRARGMRPSGQDGQKRWRFSLVTRWSALVGTLLAVGILIALALDHLLPGQPVAVLAICLLCVVPIAIITIRSQIQPILSLFRALEGTVTSYRDGDFSFSLHWAQNDELSDLVQAHNALGDVLREQRLDLVQRELLLDTMVQNTPVAMLLVT